MKYDTDTIKRVVSCRDLLSLNGIETNRKNKARCIFHDDRHASMHIFSDGKFKCFSCNAHGDVIDLACQLYSVNYAEACRILAEQNGIAPSHDDSFRKRLDEQRRQKQKRADRIEKLKHAYFGTVSLFRYAEKQLDRYRPSSPEEMPSERFFAAIDRANALRDDLNRIEWALIDLEKEEYG